MRLAKNERCDVRSASRIIPGTQCRRENLNYLNLNYSWIPAFAGMTVEVDSRSDDFPARSGIVPYFPPHPNLLPPGEKEPLTLNFERRTLNGFLFNHSNILWKRMAEVKR